MGNRRGDNRQHLLKQSPFPLETLWERKKWAEQSSETDLLFSEWVGAVQIHRLKPHEIIPPFSCLLSPVSLPMLPSNWNVHAANDDGSSYWKLQIQEEESTISGRLANKGKGKTPVLLSVQNDICKFTKSAITTMTGRNIIRSEFIQNWTVTSHGRKSNCT